MSELSKTLTHTAAQIDAAIEKSNSSEVFTTEEKTKLASLSNYDDSNISSEIASNKNANALLKGTIGYTAKNLLKVTADTTTKDGVTVTVNSDGSLTLSGTATVRTSIPITNLSNRNSVSTIPSKFILSGGTQMRGADCCIGIELSTDKNSGYIASAYDGDSGRTVDLSAYPTAKYWYALIRVESSINVDGITIYPMIRDADVSDSTYVPYSKPSIEERLSSIEAKLAALAPA